MENPLTLQENFFVYRMFVNDDVISNLMNEINNNLNKERLKPHYTNSDGSGNTFKQKNIRIKIFK